MDELGFYEDTARHFIAILVSVLFFLKRKCHNSKLSFKVHFSYKLLFRSATTGGVPCKVLGFGKRAEFGERVIPVDLSNIQTL